MTSSETQGSLSSHKPDPLASSQDTHGPTLLHHQWWPVLRPSGGPGGKGRTEGRPKRGSTSGAEVAEAQKQGKGFRAVPKGQAGPRGYKRPNSAARLPRACPAQAISPNNVPLHSLPHTLQAVCPPPQLPREPPGTTGREGMGVPGAPSAQVATGATRETEPGLSEPFPHPCSPAPARAIQNSRGHSSWTARPRMLPSKLCTRRVPHPLPRHPPAQGQPPIHALPHLPSKAARETPRAPQLTAQRPPTRPSTGPPDIQRGRASSVAHGSPGTWACKDRHHSLSPHTPGVQALCPGTLCPSKG